MKLRLFLLALPVFAVATTLYAGDPGVTYWFDPRIEFALRTLDLERANAASHGHETLSQFMLARYMADPEFFLLANPRSELTPFVADFAAQAKAVGNGQIVVRDFITCLVKYDVAAGEITLFVPIIPTSIAALTSPLQRQPGFVYFPAFAGDHSADAKYGAFSFLQQKWLRVGGGLIDLVHLQPELFGLKVPISRWDYMSLPMDKYLSSLRFVAVYFDVRLRKSEGGQYGYDTYSGQLVRVVVCLPNKQPWKVLYSAELKHGRLVAVPPAPGVTYPASELAAEKTVPVEHVHHVPIPQAATPN